MSLVNRHNIYLIGIGGIGMSALARYFNHFKRNVAGYDRVNSENTDALTDLGIAVHFDDSVSLIPDAFRNREETLIIYTPAVPESHTELQFFRENGFDILKRSEVLGLLTENSFCLAVAGTHGKTTTTSILGHILNDCGIEVTAFLGGIAENYDSNLILNGSRVTVVEADEFDRSFLTLSPDIAGITSMDADHLDIYGDKSELQRSFVEFSQKLKRGGKLLVHEGLEMTGISCGFDPASDYYATNIKIEKGNYVFDLVTPATRVENISFNLPGRHNLSNAVLALAMAIEYGCAPYSLARSLASYQGVKRRFTYHLRTEKRVLIDDYAHHPAEIKAVHEAAREMYPGKKILAVFQPHLYSRTRDFGDEFGESLADFDEVLLLEIYPARELPISGIDSSWLFKKIGNPNKKLIDKKQIAREVLASHADIIMMLGAGDIGEEVNHVKEQLSLAS